MVSDLFSVLKNTPEKRKHEEDVVVIQTPKRSSPRRPVLQENRSATVNRPHSRTKPKPRPSGNRKGNEKDSSQVSPSCSGYTRVIN